MSDDTTQRPVSPSETNTLQQEAIERTIERALRITRELHDGAGLAEALMHALVLNPAPPMRELAAHPLIDDLLGQLTEEIAQRNRSIIEFLPVPVAIVDDGRIAHLNNPFVRLLGGNRQVDFLGVSLDEQLGRDGLAAFEHAARRSLERDELPPPLVVPWSVLGGGTTDIEVTLIPTWHHGRRALLIVGRRVTSAEPDDETGFRKLTDYLARWIGQYMRGARQEGEATGRIRSTLDEAAAGICRLDTEGRVAIANRAAADLLGFSSDEMIGLPFHHAVHRHRPDGSPFPAEECPVMRAITIGRGAQARNEQFWRRDGLPVRVDYSVAPASGGAVLVFYPSAAVSRQSDAPGGMTPFLAPSEWQAPASVRFEMPERCPPVAATSAGLTALAELMAMATGASAARPSKLVASAGAERVIFELEAGSEADEGSAAIVLARRILETIPGGLIEIDRGSVRLVLPIAPRRIDVIVLEDPALVWRKLGPGEIGGVTIRVAGSFETVEEAMAEREPDLVVLDAERERFETASQVVSFATTHPRITFVILDSPSFAQGAHNLLRLEIGYRDFFAALESTSRQRSASGPS